MFNIKHIALIIFLSYPVLIDAQTITTICGNGDGHDTGDGGPATSAEITANGYGIFDIYDNYYFVEGPGDRVRRITPGGIISTYAGTGTVGFSGDGGPASMAKLADPKHIATDRLGNLYIADAANSRVRKVDALTGIITTIVGNGTMGYSGDGSSATAASLGTPYALCIDSFNNIYIGDQTYNIIRKVDAAGNISTIAGTPSMLGVSGDGGPATAALLSDIEALCTDKYGNIYMSCGNVREITIATGIINTIAGNGIMGYTGEGVLADTTEIQSPFDMRFDSYGSLYLAETHNNRIRKIDTAGYMFTVAGNGMGGYNGDGGLATNAKIYLPEGVAFDGCGNLYINDLGNYRIRKVTFDTSCNLLSLNINSVNTNADISIYPNPVYDELNISSGNGVEGVIISNVMGQVASPLPIAIGGPRGQGEVTQVVDVSGLPPGVYVVRVTDVDGDVVVRKVVKE